MSNRQYLLAARPEGMVKASDFRLVEAAVPEPRAGEVLVRLECWSLDPAMRGWMENRADYVAPLELGDMMRGGAAGEVIASNEPALPVGTRVMGSLGWQEYATARVNALTVLPDDLPLGTCMGVLGITGLTAWFGLHEIGQPRAGNTVLVSGAAGATGSVAGQLARIAGCRVVGIAGGAAKCRWLTDELGFDAAIDYRNEDLREAVRRTCPAGIDVYFDNVGGEILDIALAHIATNARVVLCGGISRYNATGELTGPKNYFNLVFRRARMEGFIVVDYAPRFDEGRRALEAELRAGRLRHHETVLHGFERLPEALIALFRGENLGKMLVQREGEKGTDLFFRMGQTGRSEG
jgi:hypothetical protein